MHTTNAEITIEEVHEPQIIIVGFWRELQGQQENSDYMKTFRKVGKQIIMYSQKRGEFCF